MKDKKAGNKRQVKEDVALTFTDIAWGEYLSWHAEDQTIGDRINDLIDECRRTPFTGTGKPEPLKGDLSGYWSRRITREHRLVYLPEDKVIYVVSCRYHY